MEMVSVLYVVFCIHLDYTEVVMAGAFYGAG